MKKVLLFLVIVLLSSNVTFSKGFLQKLKDIRTVGYEIKATKQIINDDLFADKKLFNLNLKHTKQKRNKLILSLLPFFKERQALEIIDKIQYSDDIWCYKETVDTLIEYSFNLNNRTEIYEKLLILKNKIENTNDNRSLNIKDYSDDIAASVNYFNARDYENAIQSINKTIPQLYAQINDPNNPPYATMYLKMYVKSFYFMLGGSYTYIIPPGTAEEYKYVEARDAFHKSMTEYAELLEIMKMNSYGLILRTYVYEKDIPNAEIYYKLTLETNDALNIDVAPEDEQLGEVEILILKKNYDKALEIVNNYITVSNPDPKSPKINLITAYYNRAVIYAEKEQFNKVESDLQKCMEYINEPFDPPNDNIAIVQDEVEYYKRLVEKFIVFWIVNRDDKVLNQIPKFTPLDGLKNGFLPAIKGKIGFSLHYSHDLSESIDTVEVNYITYKTVISKSETNYIPIQQRLKLTETGNNTNVFKNDTFEFELIIQNSFKSDNTLKVILNTAEYTSQELHLTVDNNNGLFASNMPYNPENQGNLPPENYNDNPYNALCRIKVFKPHYTEDTMNITVKFGEISHNIACHKTEILGYYKSDYIIFSSSYSPSQTSQRFDYVVADNNSLGIIFFWRRFSFKGFKFIAKSISYTSNMEIYRIFL